MDNCNIAIRPENVHGHITGQFHNETCKLSGIQIQRLWKAPGMTLIKPNERIALPVTKVAPFPFLKLHPDDTDRMRGKTFWGCKYCFWACGITSNTGSASTHIQELHSTKKSTPFRVADHFHKNVAVQRYFSSGGDHSWFQVHPHLSDVVEGSDFDLFYRSIQEKVDSTVGDRTAVSNDPRNYDLPPFLVKTGWSKHLEEFSRRQMVRMAGPLRSEEPEMKCIPKIAKMYLEAVTSAELTDVHPSQICRLNSWKK